MQDTAAIERTASVLTLTGTAVSSIAVAIALVLSGIAGLHVYWAGGGSWGKRSAIPERDGAPAFRPGPVACLLVAALLTSAASLVLAQGGLITLPLTHSTTKLLTYSLAFIFTSRALGDFKWMGLFRDSTSSAFAQQDARIHTPLCVLLACACILIASQSSASG
jgi:uncharacterized protein DUF3995